MTAPPGAFGRVRFPASPQRPFLAPSRQERLSAYAARQQALALRGKRTLAAGAAAVRVERGQLARATAPLASSNPNSVS